MNWLRKIGASRIVVGLIALGLVAGCSNTFRGVERDWQALTGTAPGPASTEKKPTPAPAPAPITSVPAPSAENPVRR